MYGPFLSLNLEDSTERSFAKARIYGPPHLYRGSLGIPRDSFQGSVRDQEGAPLKGPCRAPKDRNASFGQLFHVPFAQPEKLVIPEKRLRFRV